MGRRLSIAVLAFCIVPNVAVAEVSSSLRALLIEYRCPLVTRLERIYEFGNRSSSRDRFIAATVPEHRHGYVQCMFVKGGNRMLCEASSGYYYLPLIYQHPAETTAALGRLGFSTDASQGNYRIAFDVAKRPNFNAIADLILTALHDAYDARAETKLRFNAPFARRANSSCVPVS